jgi:predicted amidohydrolase YtcJ
VLIASRSSLVRWSLHSDMPMAPADPLFLMWGAANRVTASGRVAEPVQRVSAEEALRGVTIEAAYSLMLENEIGSLVRGKRANMTILDENPLSVDPMAIRDIAVWGTVMEGRVLPAGQQQKDASIMPQREDPGDINPEFDRAALEHALKTIHSHI